MFTKGLVRASCPDPAPFVYISVFLIFFSFGTGSAKYRTSSGTVPQNTELNEGNHIMFATETRNNLFAAIFAVSVSAVLYAAAIVPASPNLIA